MSPTTTGALATAAPPMHGSFGPQSWTLHAAKFTVHWGRSGAVIAAVGEIDAANAKPFADLVERCADCAEWLVLDLSELEFIGTAGFSALQVINARCAKASMHWLMVPGMATSTLLRICDPESRLPVSESLTTALAKVQNNRILRPVPPIE